MQLMCERTKWFVHIVFAFEILQCFIISSKEADDVIEVFGIIDSKSKRSASRKT